MRFKKIHYSWVILGVAFFALLLGAGLRFSFGAYVKPLENEFLVSRSSISSISFISFIINAIGQPFLGNMMDRYGSRLVLALSISLISGGILLTSLAGSLWVVQLTFGLVAALGFVGVSSVTASVIASQWFVKNRGLALGILASSFSLGQMALVPLSLYLIKAFGWRTTYQFFVVILILIVLPLVLLLLRAYPRDIGIKPYGAGEHWEAPVVSKARGLAWSELIRVIKSPLFFYLTIPYFFCGFADIGLIGTHFIPYAQERNFSQTTVATVVSLMAFLNFLGSIAAGHFSDRLDKGKMLAGIYTMRMLAILFLVTVNDPLSLMIFAIGVGLSDLASIAPVAAICAEIFSGPSLGLIFGWVALSHQLGAATGSFLPGLLYDLTGGYQASFWLAAGFMAVGSFLSLGLTSKRVKNYAINLENKAYNN